MEKAIFAVLDVQSHEFGRPLEFENVDLAVASIRRDVRDLYFAGEISYDRMKDERLVYLGTFDTVSGYFDCVDEDYRDIWNVRYFVEFDELKQSDKELEERLQNEIKEYRKKVFGEDEVSD